MKFCNKMKKYLNNNFDLWKYVEFADESPVWSAEFGYEIISYSLRIVAALFTKWYPGYIKRKNTGKQQKT